ncbi:MAG: MBL fold metallo-hydrolase, partial [Holophagae bacterium]|nr:MBL fold metallo-hydrolase [Holophagae bacterium]
MSGKKAGRILIMMALLSSVFMAADTIQTTAGPLEITLLGHASLMLKAGDTVIFIDPFSRVAEFARLPKADIILITHSHRDHLDPAAVNQIRQGNTKIFCAKSCRDELQGSTAMANGDTLTPESGIVITAVPAYNILHKRPDGTPYHPKGEGNGYLIQFGGKRIYVAGDTENTPEMKSLTDIDVAFLPVNLPYTMDAEMVMDAVRAMKPDILYPYHYAYGTSDLEKLRQLMTAVV